MYAVSPPYRSLVWSVAAALLSPARSRPAAGIEEAVKAMQAGDMATAEKDLQVLVKERDPRAQFLLGLYVYGNPDSKMFDLNKAAPLLLDAAERGYVPAMIPLAGAYAEGKGVPKSLFDSYKWLAIAERWNAPNAAAAARAGRARAEARRNREGQGRGRCLHLQDQMIARGRRCSRRCSSRQQPSARSRPTRPTSRRRCARRSPPIAPAISPRPEPALRAAGRRAMPMPKPGSARCCSIADATREALRRSSTPPTPARAEGAHRLALVYAAGRWRHAAQRRRARSSCSRRPRPPAIARAQINARHALLPRPGHAARSHPGARLAREGGGDGRSLRALRAGPRHGRKRRARPWPTRCAPPISIGARRSMAIRSPRCATAWR